MMKFLLAAVLLAAQSAWAQTAAPKLAAPKLIVVISVDQLSSNLFGQYRDEFTGGFKTLADGGIVYANGYQAHAATETCPGHATILTGRRPNGTGIIANSWYDKKTGKDIYCTASAGYKVPGSNVPSGPANLMTSTLGDWMKNQNPQNRVYAVAGKDRSAIMMAGHKADGVYWFERGPLKFATYLAPGETDYAKKIAPLTAFNDGILPRWQAKPPVWTLAYQKCLERSGAYKSGAYGWESKVPPQGYVPLPGQPFTPDKAFLSVMRASPAYDRLVTDAALSLIKSEKLGQGPGTDMIAIGLSATDYIGHAYGIQGVEMCDHILKVDGMIADIVAAAKAQGPSLIVLTADHGGLDAVERVQEQGEPSSYRYEPRKLADKINEAMQKQLKLKAKPFTSVGADEDFVEVDQLHFTNSVPLRKRAKIAQAAIAWLKQQPMIETAFATEETRNLLPPADLRADEWSMAHRVAVNHYDGRSGDIYVIFKPYGLTPATRGYIASHGTPYDYDRRVPILFYGPGIPPQERPLPVEVIDIAPTLAHILGITPDKPVDGRCLTIGNFTSGPCK